MLRARALRLAGFPVLALTLFSACYRYVPATTSDLVIGGSYRAHLTTQGTQQVARLMGEDVGRFDGRILTVSDSGYLVAMSATHKRNDDRQTVWTGEQLMVPKDAVNNFELRELDRPRTVRAAALYTLGIAVIGGLVLSISGVVSGSPPGPGGPPPP